MKRLLRELMLRQLWGAVAHILRRDRPRVISINGSVGKSSTKEALASILQSAGVPVEKTVGNLATDFGVPLSLLGFTDQPGGLSGWSKVLWRTLVIPRRQYHDVPTYVLEFSSDAPGDTAFLTHRIPSHASILTTIVPVHLEGYGSEKAMVRETVSQLDGIMPGGYAVLNADDPHQKNIKTQHRTIWYGLALPTGPSARRPGAWATTIRRQASGLQFTLVLSGRSAIDGPNSKRSECTIVAQVLAEYQLYPLLAAAAAAYQEGVSLSHIKKGLERYQVPAGRGRLIEGKKGTSIIDDTVNASPEAVKAGLKAMKEWAGNRRTVAILGTMNELGKAAKKLHLEVARAAAESVDFLVTVGEYGEAMVEEARQHGMSPFTVLSFRTPEQLLDKLNQVVESNDVVFVKASQNGMRLERVVKKLMAHPRQAEKLLVRQGPYWKKDA